MLCIRKAVPSDVERLSEVMISSIRDLCAADHLNDPAAIADWCANKSPETVRDWIEDGPGLTVSLNGATIAAVGGNSTEGAVRLLYVAPEFQTRGHGGALLRHMEDAMRKLGVRTSWLASSATAHAFYLSQGWNDDGPCHPTKGQPMRKRLSHYNEGK